MKATLFLRILLVALILTLTSFVVHAQISPDELMIYYSFDEDAVEDGEVVDLSGNENNGFLRGANLQFVEGKVNGALQFPGANSDYIAVQNHHYADLFPEITMAVWIKTAVRGMIASWDRSEFFRFGAGDDVLGNTTKVGFDVCCPIGDWHGETEVTDDAWHHVVVTFNADTKRIYVDGKLDAEQATHTNDKRIGKVITRYGFLGIGSEAAVFNGPVGPNWAFNGLMDEFLLFHRAISEDEVTILFNASGNPLAVDPAGKLSATWGQIKHNK